MYDCEEIRDLLSESLDRALTSEEQNKVFAHTSECEECAAYREDLRFVRDTMAGRKAEVPEHLHENIMHSVTAEIEKTTVQVHHPAFRLPVLTMVVAAAACVMLVATGVVGDVMNLLVGSHGSTAAADAAQMPSAADFGRAAPKEIPEAAQDRMITAPDTATTGSSSAPAIPDSLAGLHVAFAYQITGGEAPKVSGELLDEVGGVRYYEIANNMTAMERLFDEAEKAGCTVEPYSVTGLTIDAEAEIGLLLVAS